MQSRHKLFTSPCEQVRIWGRFSKIAHLLPRGDLASFQSPTHFSALRLYPLTTLEQDGPADQRISSQTPYLISSFSVFAVTFILFQMSLSTIFSTSCYAYYLKPCREMRSGQKCFECDHCVPKQIARPPQASSM